MGGGLEGLEYDTVQIDEPKEISAAGSNLGSLSPLLDSILPPPSISNGNTQETELAKVDYHEEEERSESSSDSFGQSLPMVQSLKSLPQPISEEQDTKIILSQEDILDNDLDSFDGKLSISKSKPPLPPPSIGFKELPPRQDKIYIKSEIEKRLESLSAERSKRIAKILRDN